MSVLNRTVTHQSSVGWDARHSSPSLFLGVFQLGKKQKNHFPILLPQGSLRKEFPTNIGGSDVCFFCRKRVYVMERLSAEGKFFHRSCFKCEYCGTTLRLSSYAFDVEDGKNNARPTTAENYYFFSIFTCSLLLSREVLLQAALLLPRVGLRSEETARPLPSSCHWSGTMLIPWNPLSWPLTLSSWLTRALYCPHLQENQVPQAGMAAVDAPGRVMVAEAAPAIQLPPSGSPFKCLALVATPRRLAKSVVVPLHSLRNTLFWTCHQVALNPLDSPFLCTYCIYLLCCFTINVLLSLV